MGTQVGLMAEKAPKKLCHAQRQAFIDCMFVHSKCVQSGEKPFKDCLEEEQQAGTMHEDCAKLFHEFQICRLQLATGNDPKPFF